MFSPFVSGLVIGSLIALGAYKLGVKASDWGLANDEEESIVNLVERLKQYPDEMFCTEEFLAVWSSALNDALIFPGDFSNYTTEQANHFLVTQLTASLN